MPPAKKPRAANPRRKKESLPPICARSVWARTQLLVEVLLEVMEKEIRNPDSERSEQWLKLFGPKDSAVVNLQKLVQLLAQLQEQDPHSAESVDQPVVPVSDEELALLSDWLKTTR